MDLTIDWRHSQPDTELASQCMTALRAGLKQDELEMLMNELSLDHLDEYKQKPVPSKPMILVRFDADRNTSEWQDKTPAEKQNISKRIMDRDDVKEYYEKSNSITCDNLSILWRLEGMIRGFLEWGEAEKAKRCWSMYQQFPEVLLLGGGKVLWKKRRKW